MKKNFKFAYIIFHPEYLVDLLRAGGRFPLIQSFSIPSPDSTLEEIGEFVDKQLPPLSEERYEIWLKFRLPDDPSISSFSLADIVSSHFYNEHRQQATSGGVIQTLEIYGIPLLEPLEDQIAHVLEIYDSKVRENTANLIVKTWFPGIQISKEFINQLRVGYKYQQSPSPENLPPIPSELIWAHLVAYNHGLRKFDERPLVLWLQDIQEVFRRNDSDFKQRLKSLGEKFNSKFSDILDDAEKARKNRIESSKWIIESKNKTNTYFSELDKHLSDLGCQQSFFYSALFYLNWRESVLNADYTGRLSDHKRMSYFLNNSAENPMSQAIAEALFTIIYAGGPRIFQKALIEARLKTHSIPVSEQKEPILRRLFIDNIKDLAGNFYKAYQALNETKKKEIQKELRKIGTTITKVKKGEFNHDQHLSLCSLFEIKVVPFDDYPLVKEAIAFDSLDQPEKAANDIESSTVMEKQTFSPELINANEVSIKISEEPASGNDEPLDDIQVDDVHSMEQAEIKSNVTLNKPDSSALGSDSSSITEKDSSVAEKKNSNEQSTNESEATALATDKVSEEIQVDNDQGENQLKTNEKFKGIAEDSDEINKKGNKISDQKAIRKGKAEKKRNGRQGWPNSINKPGTLPIDFPEG